MLNLPWLLIPGLSSFALILSAGQVFGSSTSQNIWESFAPGELLRILEHSTSTIPGSIYSAVSQRRSGVISPAIQTPAKTDNVMYFPTPKSKQNPTGSPIGNTYIAEDQLNAPSSDEFNYDQAYEDFVRQYFSDKLAEENDFSGDNEETLDGDNNESEEMELEAEHNSSLAETEPRTEETNNRAQTKTKNKCRRVRKHKQSCFICENARNGEKSESCSFSRESEPQKYAFERERSYKKQRDTDEPSSQSVEEQRSSEETESVELNKRPEQVNKRNIDSKRASRKPSSDSRSTCIQMVKQGKICYQCIDGDGTTTKCYVPREPKDSQMFDKARPAKGKDRKVQKTQQRIYKRTISYSFEKGTNGTTSDETPVESGKLEDATTSSTPLLKEKIFIKGERH